MKRIIKLINALEKYGDYFCYYDEDLDETIIDGTEEEVYNFVIEEDPEIRFLGKKIIKSWIHLWFIDWEAYEKEKFIQMKLLKLI